MNMFYLIDTSGSMNHNGCIESVNEAMPEIIEILRDVTLGNKDYGEIFVNCIAFSNRARLLEPMPVSALDYSWSNLEAYGLTNMGEAFDLLDAQLRPEAALGATAGNLRPAVILLSDGDPDSGWESHLESLRENPWFADSYKIAIAIGAAPDKVAMRKAISEFTAIGGKGSVISVTDMGKLTEVIRTVSATVSRIASRARVRTETGTETETVDRQIHAGISAALEPLDGVDIPAIAPDSPFWD